MKNIYSFSEVIKNIVSLITTKIFFPRARLIRNPIYVRGKRFLHYGVGFTTGYRCRIEIFEIDKFNGKKLIIGDNCKIGDQVHIAVGESVKIGSNCLFASNIFISDISHGDYKNNERSSSPDIPPDNRPLFTKPISIGKNVWIGEHVCVLPGVSIGDGAIIGANTVVNVDIPENSIAVGSPSRIVKKYDSNISAWVRV